MQGDIVIPYSVMSIGAVAFQSTGISSITFNKNVNLIPYDCVSSCGKLTSVICESDVTEIEYNAFKNCSLLKDIEINWGALNKIGDNAFNGCKSLSGEIILNRNCSYNIENSFLGTNITIRKN